MCPHLHCSIPAVVCSALATNLRAAARPIVPALHSVTNAGMVAWSDAGNVLKAASRMSRG